jgi:hypothetical protein
MALKPKILAPTISDEQPGPNAFGLWHSVLVQNFSHARRFLALGAALDVPFSDQGRGVTRLTATALSARMDSMNGELFWLPWILNRGGNIREVDGRGRTLLDHVQTRMCALYLLENGVPVAEGMRDALVDAFRQPSGVGSFDRSVVLAAATGRTKEPAVFDMVRHRSASKAVEASPVHVPKTTWKDVLPMEMVEAMTGAGLGEGEAVARLRDPLVGLFGPMVGTNLCLNAQKHLLDAMWDGDRRRVATLIGLGAYDGQRVMPEPSWQDTGLFLKRDGMTAVAVAALLDSAFGGGGVRTPGGWVSQDGNQGALHLLPLFEGVADFGGVHATGGQTLLHLYLAPAVVEWLVERGAPYDIADEEGNVPEEDEVWPDDTRGVAIAAVYARHRLSTWLPEAAAPATRQHRRL